MSEACSFCDIARRHDPDAREVYRDERVVAFFPTEPATLGHTLVIPREHVPDIWSLRLDTADAITKASLRVAMAIREAFEPEGLNVIQSNGAAASQTVLHLHVHLVPRWAGDRIGQIWPRESNYSERQKNLAWDEVREALQQRLVEATPPEE